ncbi:MAG: hypothetical protein RJA67_211 [Bacteroidota bacterium]|jgi:hypothetical protein
MIFLNECYLVNQMGRKSCTSILRLCAARVPAHALPYKVSSGLYSLKNGLPPSLSPPYLGCAGSALGNQVDGNNASS